jgi:membrane associated rhomboid family serine protease
MLYDRSYMRQTSEPAGKQTSVVTTLLVITIGIFVLQQMLNVFFPGMGGRDNYFLTDWFALSGQNFRELKVWTVFSYAFMHSTQTIMHLIGNMLGLFFIGRILEPLLGKQQFLVLYFTGALVGGLTYIAFHFNGSNPVVGASAAVFALVAFFCLRHPEQPITLLLFFVLPLTVKPKWLFRAVLAYSVFALLFTELPGNAHVAHSAHLGGLLVGVIYFRYAYTQQAFFSAAGNRPSVELPEWFKRTKKTERNISYRVNRTSSKDLQQEVDRILDKINHSGFGSLDANEKATLDQAKDILGK